MKKRFIEIAVKVIVAALTAFLTAITTTSCMGYGPLYGPLPKIVQISQMKSPLAVAGESPRSCGGIFSEITQ